ncbi:unnamed protein product, partial [Mesorhabditis spiculigera]
MTEGGVVTALSVPSNSLRCRAQSECQEARQARHEVTKLRMSSKKGVGDKLHQGDRTYESIDEFLRKNVDDKHKRTPIRKILVATNGIAAVKCMQAMRKQMQQLFNNDHIVSFICMTTEHEIRSNAEYLKLADCVVHSPGGDNKNNYANVHEIVSHAMENKVDAVWAGWGHASENPELPKKLHENNIMFIGPPSNAMFSLGDKIASSIIAQTVNIPTINWSGSGLKLDTSGHQKGPIEVSTELFRKACVLSVQEGLEAMRRHNITYPMMIKASEGGGGKGIRKCKNEADFRENFDQVQAEVPNSPIFLMKCLENARHIEVQLLADRYGTTIPIFTRDCSIQRRCQKIIEEAPACIAPERTLRRMQEDAVRIANLVGYESAGTVEYMYLPDEDKYFFLELNPRLQVEHPCTEMLASINIPAIQLQIAMGLPLHRIEEIRLFYDLDRYGDSPLPVQLVRTDAQYAVIAARITSEDPEDFFRPSTGSLEYLQFRSAQNVWGYFSVSSAGKVHEFADSQFGHLFARGRTRHEAVSSMLCALQELELRASFASQVSYLVDLLKEADFTQNRFNTQWLDNRIANKVVQKAPLPRHEMMAVSSAVIGHARIFAAFNNFKCAVQRGQVLPTKDLTETFLFDLVKDMSIYRVQVTRTGPLTYRIELNGAHTEVEIRLLGDGSLLVTHNDRCYTCHLEETAERFKVTIGRSLVVFEKDNDPSVLKSPYTGKLLSFKKENREWVNVGQVYAQIESMKLVFNVEVKRAPGRLVHVAKEGDLLYPGSVIAKLVDQKDCEKYKPQPFTQPFEEWTLARAAKKTLTEPKRFSGLYDRCVNILNGTVPPGTESRMPDMVAELFECLENPKLAVAMCAQALQSTRLPEEVLKKLREAEKLGGCERFDRMLDVLNNYLAGLAPTEWETARAVCNTLYTTCDILKGGTFGHTVHVLNQLLDEYKHIESYFEGRTYDDAVAMLNQEFETDKDRVVAIIYSHTQIKKKNIFMQALLNAVELRGMHLVAPLAENLREIGNMFQTEEVSEKCRNLLLQNNYVKYRKFVNKVLWDAGAIPVEKRDVLEVKPVQQAIEGIRAHLRQIAATKDEHGMQRVLKISPWVHKVLHEYFFDEICGDLAVRAYIGLHFTGSAVTASRLKCGATAYDFSVDSSSLVHAVANFDSQQHISIIKFPAATHQTLIALTGPELVSELISRYNGLKTVANGRRTPLRVTFLVEMPEEEAMARKQLSNHREALLEELPANTKEEDETLAMADRVATEVRDALSQKLSAFEVSAHVLVCQPNRPLVQLDMMTTERLELWRLPSEAQLVSDRFSSLRVFKYDDVDRKHARLFVREVVEVPVRDGDNFYDETQALLLSEIDSACGAINVTMRRFDKQRKSVYVSNHILLHVTFPKLPRDFTKKNEEQLDLLIEEAIREQRAILLKHSVTEVEVVLPKVGSDGRPLNRRVKFHDTTGVTAEFGIFDEHQRHIITRKLSHQLYGEQLHRHNVIRKIEKKRAVTKAIGTTYVYDLPMLFGRATLERWKTLQEEADTSRGDLFNRQLEQLSVDQQEAFFNGDHRPFFSQIELTVRDGVLIKVTDQYELRRRADNCNNETGVVAWQLTLHTPEKPLGYTCVVIANDITFQSGSFAMPEDHVYTMASEYSRKHKIPRVNISANSGARIGIADEVAQHFRAKFKDPEHPEEGFDYLYVNADVDERVKEQLVYEKMPNQLELRIKAVIGRTNEHIGVENLQGSGLIAGETSAAYDQVPTYCLVTGRSVGIGAYTARLAHRIVQTRNSHLILTGAGALNTVLGKEVYTSNNQLGGIQIMHKNGVTHNVVEDDFEGVCKILHWLSYLPDKLENFPYMRTYGTDSAPRPVTFPIEDAKIYDVRQLIDSRDSKHFEGICDSNSFDEIMSEWAKTIVAGRARLGGIPIGVLSSELRNVKTTIPADPACTDSQSIDVHQAGQVWYPDSAFKTAEAINDFNRENLPLLFIASLRGFSGGQQDMYQMVLKFGAHIVDALRNYKQPVIIYIPSGGELRGGAWVVLDSKINPGFIQMVADEESRGGILEPPAVIGIKFKAEKMRALQRRNDPILIRLQQELDEAKKADKDPVIATTEATRLRRLIDERSEGLLKAYRGVAVEFADLHDRAERMQKKGAVQHVTPLRESRNLFINILKTESAKIALCERYLVKAPRDATPQEAYEWVGETLEKFHSGFRALGPAEQYPVVAQFVEGQEAQKQLRAVHEGSVERDLLGLSDDELRQMKALLEKCAAARRISL